MQTKTNRRSRSSGAVNRKKFTPKSNSRRRRFQGGNSPVQGDQKRRGGRSHFGGRRHGNGNKRRLPTFDPSQFINKNPVEAKEEHYTPQNDFTTFGLDPRLVHTVLDMGFSIPSPIQDKVIPVILEGNDVIGLAETGTGKTAAFLLPLIHKTLKDSWRQTLILAPTRELAIQIENELHKLTKGMKVYSVVCVGGTGIGPQIKKLRNRNHFIIGTPGRVLDLIRQKHFTTTDLSAVVLDEADRMLDMGFIHDIRSILKATPRDRETHFFSATIDKNTKDLVTEFLQNPIEVSVKKKDVTNSIEQDVVRYRDDSKLETLVSLFDDTTLRRVIVFGAMKHKVQKLSEDLNRRGIASEAIHGNKTHGQRQRALAKFKSGNARVLVATDVAARGIHVDNVSHVINYDLPTSFEDYVHRIGRTGRSDKKGKALTFVAK